MLRYYLGLDVREIAEHLGIAEGTVKAMLFAPAGHSPRCSRNRRRCTVPTDDPRLARALHDAAPAVDTAGVLDRVRRSESAAAGNAASPPRPSALAIVLLVVVTTVLVTTGDGSSPHVAAPGAGLSARVVTGRDASADGQAVRPQPVTLDADPGVLVAPVSVGSHRGVDREPRPRD